MRYFLLIPIFLCLLFQMWQTYSDEVLTDQERFCLYKDGVYEVNSFGSNETFVPNGSNTNETISQVIKRKGSLFFMYLRYKYYDGTYQAETSVYEYTCKDKNSVLLFGNWTWFSESWTTLTRAEIDMVDDRFIITRVYVNTWKWYLHEGYDRELKKPLNFNINSIPNFSSFLDFKPMRLGVWRVLVRIVGMKTKWMRYDLFQNKIY